MLISLDPLSNPHHVQHHIPPHGNMTCINKPIYMDYDTLILNNCKFISDGQVRTIIGKNKPNEYRAYVTRSARGTRGVLLTSDGADTPHGALESLFDKSAEAAGHYITTNGFSLPPDTKSLDMDSDDDDDDDAVSVSSSSSIPSVSDADTSDDEYQTVTPPTSYGSLRPSSFPPSLNNGLQANSRKSVSKSSKSRGPRLPQMGNGATSLQAMPPVPRFAHPGPTTRPPLPRCSGSHLPPPPPPPPMSHGPQNPVRGPTVPLQQPHSHPNNPLLPTAGPQPSYPPPPPGFTGFTRIGPLPRPAPAPPAVPSVQLFDVRLTLRGSVLDREQRLLDNCRPSIRALQASAIAHVRSSSPFPEAAGLRAIVRQAFFGDEAYDMTKYRGDDLTKLFNVLSMNTIPSFEIDIDAVPTPPPFPAPRPNPENNVMGHVHP